LACPQTPAQSPARLSQNEAQNAQTRKDAFLKTAQNRGAAEDYLRYTRDAPLSRYEIKAGWEIPAVLEQSLNSDLPGELKALVTSNVYDTASGQYLLIPQGARLVGKYDSRVSYGQDGVQVAWSRIIFPDASSIDLDGMLGLDSHGDAGLRDKVDHHYKRLIGMSVLTSMFMAAFAISQNRTQTILAYPTPSHAAETAVGQELSMTGAQMARRNMNVQPTIKVAAGYRFTCVSTATSCSKHLINQPRHRHLSLIPNAPLSAPAGNRPCKSALPPSFSKPSNRCAANGSPPYKDQPRPCSAC
jgi:type IV secretion system protein TrbI